MNTVKILIEGYARVNSDNTWDATSTTTLVKSNDLKIVIDPGCNRELLLSALNKEGLEVGDINVVFVSHYHPDHCLLMGIFPNATVIDSVQWQKGPLGGETGDSIPDTDIQIIKTPGHTSDHASLIVSSSEGKILVGADVFWWAEGEDQVIDVNKSDPFASDQKLLTLSRSSTLQLCDFIIPGHGHMFKSPK